MDSRSRSELDAWLDRRVALACLPTPVHHYPRCSERLGFELFVKRDDLTESVASGNKIRKLEYVLHQALQRGADTLVSCGGIQSNHCRAVAWTAARAGLSSVLLLRGQAPAHATGNLLFDRLLGAQIRFHSVEEFKGIGDLGARVCEELRGQGRKPFWIPIGASTATGSLGYVRMMKEIADAGLAFDQVYCALGSGGTFAGILLGHHRYGLPGEVRGIAVCDTVSYFVGETVRIQKEFQDQYGIHLDLTGVERWMDDRYVGDGYALNTEKEWRQLIEVARIEGLILDPVYTLKAFLGMVGQAGEGIIRKGSRVLFVHSGGHLGLTAKNEELERYL